MSGLKLSVKVTNPCSKLLWTEVKRSVSNILETGSNVFYPWVMLILTARITEAFGLPKPSLFSNYKVVLLLCHLRVNWIQIQVMWYLSSCWLVVINHAIILLHNFWAITYFMRETWNAISYDLSYDNSHSELIVVYHVVQQRCVIKHRV